LTSQDERRHQLLKCAEAVANLAEHRGIEPIRAHLVRHDREYRRVLETIVRRWSRLTEPQFISPGAEKARGAPLHLEHVVPCRVIGERMIMEPSECRALLETAVIIARVTPAEHKLIGGLYPRHEDVHRRMLKAPVSLLPELGKERYSATGIELKPTSK
jgi:hypothetical protein